MDNVARSETTRAARMPPLTSSKRLQNALGRDWSTALWLMLPTVVLMGGIIAYPFLRAVYISFTNTVSVHIGPFVGLKNYIDVWSDQFFRRSLWITIKFTVSSVALKVVFGILIASLLNRLGRWGAIFTGLVLLPWIIPDIVRAITWKSVLDPIYGGVNRALLDLGIIKRPLLFLGGINTALPTLVMINLWQGIPFFVINILAGLKAIDHELYEAAAIDGASGWRQFLHITLPGLRYVLIVVTLLSTIWTFNSFTLIFLLTGGGPMDATKVYSILSYNWGIGANMYGRGIAVALSMAPVLGIFIVVLGRYMMQGRRLYEVEATGEPGIFARIGTVIAWPFKMLLRAILALFWAINDTIERIGEWIGGLFHRDSVDHEPSRRRPKWAGQIIPAVALFLLLGFELLPFYWVIVTAFKTELQITRFESVYWPQPWTLDQFRALLGPHQNFTTWLKNTMIVSIVTPAISTVLAAASAYALTRLHWRGARQFSNLVLVAYLMPAIMMLIPIYQLFAGLKLTNSLWALFLSYPTFALPFAIWLMMGYYATIPEELEAAALVDGCNRFQAFTKVVLPLTKPALMAVALFGVTQAWSEFLFAYVFIQSESKMTIPVGLSQMIIGDVLPWGQLSAAALIMAVPVLMLYIVGQKFMVAGLTAGAMKGGG
jgi:multiple sugar transport system permease protein